MFTGVIQEKGTISAVRERSGGIRLTVKRRGRSRLQRGESIAVSGVCLTVLTARNGAFDADLSTETLARSTLRQLQRGDVVNLERALRLSDRLGGHMVQGHVDAVGRTLTSSRRGEFLICRWSFPSEFRDLVVSKGSIAVNGVSLTIVEPDQESFAAALIPETLSRTNLGGLQPGDAVNLEFDIIGKYVRQFVQPWRGTR